MYIYFFFGIHGISCTLGSC